MQKGQSIIRRGLRVKTAMTALLLLVGVTLAVAQNHVAQNDMIAQNDTVAKKTVAVDSLAQHILDYAAQYLGTPYRYGSGGPKRFDCSGFTSYVFRPFGYNLSRSCLFQVQEGEHVDKNTMKAGDLIFFTSRRSGKKVGHVGIVVENPGDGNIRFIHASVHGVRYSQLTDTYYAKRYITGVRVLPEAPHFWDISKLPVPSMLAVPSVLPVPHPELCFLSLMQSLR
ncbi:nlp/p60 protein [Candidatus Symbiothrix dinenymphae]|nr:nlp/p60 protein [Candidatus Symbiothrix dinenymphae]